MNNTKKVYISKFNVITLTFKKLNSFHYIQSLLLKTSILIYFNSK